MAFSARFCLIMATTAWPSPRLSMSPSRDGDTAQKRRFPAYVARSATHALSLFWARRSPGAIPSQVIDVADERATASLSNQIGPSAFSSKMLGNVVSCRA
jgi:hypothetical protein